jgi:hypothetical protein
MDTRNIFSYGKRLEFSPFNTKNDESPFTCFAKNLRYSPMVNKPSLLWPKYGLPLVNYSISAPRGGKSPSPWRLPIEEEDYTGLSPFKRKEFSAMKNRQYSHYDEEYILLRLNNSLGVLKSPGTIPMNKDTLKPTCEPPPSSDRTSILKATGL